MHENNIFCTEYDYTRWNLFLQALIEAMNEMHWKSKSHPILKDGCHGGLMVELVMVIRQQLSKFMDVAEFQFVTIEFMKLKNDYFIVAVFQQRAGDI